MLNSLFYIVCLGSIRAGDYPNKYRFCVKWDILQLPEKGYRNENIWLRIIAVGKHRNTILLKCLQSNVKTVNEYCFKITATFSLLWRQCYCDKINLCCRWQTNPFLLRPGLVSRGSYLSVSDQSSLENT